MKNLVKSFGQFINEGYHGMEKHLSRKSECCGSDIDENDYCTECGEDASINLDNSDEPMGGYNEPQMDSQFEKKSTRKEVLKSASSKYPQLEPEKMKKTLSKMKGNDFKAKAEKYFGWADEPEAAAASFIRKATKKEPRDI